ncbi:internal virion protein with endolysin domain [Pseudomonas phage vB_PpuP-Kurenuki]
MLTALERQMDIQNLESADAVVESKNAAELQNEVNDARELRATPSGYGDRLDRDRATDRGVFRAGVSVRSIKDIAKAAKGTHASLSGFAKNAVVQALGVGLDKAEKQGASEDDLQRDGISLIQQGSQNTYSLANRQAKAGAVEPQYADPLTQITKIEQAQVEQEKFVQSVGFGDQVGAAFNQMTILPALMKQFQKEERPADPTYNYSARRDEVEQGLSEADRQYMRQSRSLAEEQDRMAEVKANMEDNRKLGAHGVYWATAAGLTGGLLDPVGWGLGLGVGKVAQVTGMSAATAFKAGQVTKGVALGALEGTVANVGITAVLDAAGGHVTDKDYAYAAGFGLAFGGIGAFAGIRGATQEGLDARVADAADTLRRGMDDTLADAHVQMRDARERAGAKAPDAEPVEDIVTRVQDEVNAQATGDTDVPIYEVDYKGVNRRPGAQVEGQPTGAKAALDGLSAHPEPLVATMAARLRTLIGDDIKVVTGEKVNRSFYDVGTHTVYMRPGADPTVQLHEITHALTAHRMRFGDVNPESAIGALTKEIDALHLMAQDAAKKQGFKDYHLQNRDEFVAGLFTNKKAFNEFLASVPVNNDGKTLLTSFVQAVRRILGMGANEESLLTRAIGVSEQLVSQPLQVKSTVHSAKGKQKVYEFSLGGEVRAAGERIQHNANVETAKMMDDVALRTGPEPTPEAVQKELDNIMRERYNNAMNIVHARVRNSHRFLPQATEADVTPDGKVVPPNDLLLPKAEREAIGASWGIDESLVANPADIQVLTEMAARATRWANENPVDAARVDSILGKAPWLASTGLQLAKSEHPAARMIAGLLLENTTGALGRGRTAALDKNILQRQYDEYLANAEQHYTAWRNRNNGSILTDIQSGELRDRFQREVSQEIRSRESGAAPHDSDPDVKLYVDQLEQGFDRMRVDQQARSTIGAARLGDSSRGYSPRQISKKWARSATAEQRRALSKEFADQLDQQWNDMKFAQKIATGYVERARMEAGGGVAVPSNIYSDEASDILKDVMRASGVPDDQIEKLLGKFSRGGAGHTKQRLDLDLDQVVRTEAGDEFRIADAFEHDQAKLYQQYSRRVSGEVALANFGIYGQHGMMQLRRLLADFGPGGNPASIEQIRAFDQIAAEFYGRPLPGTGNKALGNIRLLGSTSMLGGMAFNQLAEFSNALPLLGFGGALKQVGSLPRLIQEVRKGTPNKFLSSLEVVGGPIGHDQRVVFPYQELDDTQVWGAADLNAFDRVVRGGAQAMPWLSGFHYVHAAQLRGISEQIVMKSMRYIRAGDENVALTSMGFNEGLRARISRDLDNIAEFGPNGELTALDITKTTDPEAMSEFVQAVHRGSKQIIQGTYIGETGAWAHDDLLRILTQFRTFSITSMEKQWSRQRADQGTIKAMGLLLGSMSFAIPLQAARIQLNAAGREDGQEYIDRQMAPAMFARSLLNYSSISGVLGDVIDSGAALTGNTLSGGRSGQQGSALEAIPALGYVSGLVGAVKERDPRELLRALPGQNLPFLTPLMNLAD